jgi:hypothetical protein
MMKAYNMFCFFFFFQVLVIMTNIRLGMIIFLYKSLVTLS